VNLILLRSAMRQFGLAKVASTARALRREESPLQDTLPAAAACIGTKLAAFRLKQANTQAGLDALESVLDDPTEKTASDHAPASRTTVALYSEMVRTQKLAEVLPEAGLAPQRLALWNSFKVAAEKDSEGPVAGLAKIALKMWADHEDAGYKTASSRADREALATSFASALLVDVAAEKLAEEGHLDANDLAKIASLNAESALEDLYAITKHAFNVRDMAGRLGQFAYENPEATGAMALAPVGAALGAWDDKDNRLRGAAAGGAGGAALGAVGGHAFRHYRDHSTQGFREGLDAFDAASAAYHASRVPDGAHSPVAPQHFTEAMRQRGEGDHSPVAPQHFTEAMRARETLGEAPGYIPNGAEGPDMNSPQIQKFLARQEAAKRLAAQGGVPQAPAAPAPQAPAAPDPLAALKARFNRNGP
jgi:hypothetical protein